MSAPKVTISSDQRCTCIQCGHCCRAFYVGVTQREIASIRALPWNDEQELPPEPLTESIQRKRYFRRRETGECVFLDPESELCRIHTLFGFRSKALTCKGYPLNIAATYPGEVSVIARMDCPAVRKNDGEPLTENRKEILDYVRQMRIRGGFSKDELDGLCRESVELITSTFVNLIRSEKCSPPQDKAIFLFSLISSLQELGTGFLNDTPTLKEILPSLIDKSASEAAVLETGTVGLFSRIVFRVWLATCLRQDEITVRTTLRQRIRRSLEFCRYLVGFGSFSVISPVHPHFSLSRAQIFSALEGDPAEDYPWFGDADAWSTYWRLLLTRIDALQFFGTSYYGAGFFDGLRALMLTFPLVLAGAKYNASASGRGVLTREDVDYAVGAIDHSLGRSPLLAKRQWRIVERYFGHIRYRALIETMIQ